MSPTSPKNKKTQFGPKFPFVVTAVLISVLIAVAATVKYYDADAQPGLLIGVLIVFLVLNLMMLFQDDATVSQQKESRREHRRHLARKKEVSNLRAQLRKPDFETRLRSFTRTDGKNETQEVPESQMEFWEKSAEYSRTPTRPIELIRYLLQRISKLVGQG